MSHSYTKSLPAIQLLFALLFIASGFNSIAQTNIWVQKSDLGCNASNVITPSARDNAVSFSIGSKGYLGTGSDILGYKKDFWEYDPAANTWTQKADFGGTARSGAVGFSIEGKGYLGTGSDNLYHKKDFWEYDPAINNWTQKTDFGGSGRYAAVGFSISSKGYIGTGDTGSIIGDINDFWEYDPVSDTWTQRASVGPISRLLAVGFSIGIKGYIGTGYSDDYGLRKDFWEYDSVNNTWIQKADFAGTARDEAVGFSIGSKGYIGTGYDGNKTKDFWEYDPFTNTWTQKEHFGGSSCQSTTGFSIGSKGYLGTGNSLYGITSDFWEYNSDSDTWTQKKDFGGTERYHAVGFSIGSKGYLGTGFIYTTPRYLKDFWEYDPDSNTWAQKADFGGSGRWKATGFSIGNKGYLGTGADELGFKKDFWEYDPATNTWIQKADFGGSARIFAVGFNIGNKGYLGTGPGNKDFWEYDPSTNTWTQKMDFGGSGRSSAVGFAIFDKGYVGTGYDGTFLKDIWEYNPNTDQWIQKTDFPGEARYHAVGFSISSKGYLGTGSPDYFEYLSDFWEYNPAVDSWVQKAEFYWGGPRSSAVGFSMNGKGYIGTGYNDSYYGSIDYFKDFWEYTPDDCAGFMVYLDADGDGYGDAANSFFVTDCILPVGYELNDNDCDDGNPLKYPDAGETCDNIDNNCNGSIDEGISLTFYADADNDGFGNPNITMDSCAAPLGFITDGTDCDDANASINPLALEICDNIDNNCNGNIDEGVLLTFYADADNDGFGNPNNMIDSCSQPSGYLTDNTDCDDTNPNIFPGAQEILFNGLDDNCDGYIDEFGTGIEEINSTSFFTISPNPANIQTTIQFTLLHSSQVSVSVFDLNGKKIKTLINEELQQGDHSLQINTSQFSKGIYLVKMITNGGIENQKLIIQ